MTVRCIANITRTAPIHTTTGEPATVYRNVPTREARVTAAYRHEERQFSVTAESQLKTDRPLEALRK